MYKEYMFMFVSILYNFIPTNKNKQLGTKKFKQIKLIIYFFMKLTKPIVKII